MDLIGGAPGVSVGVIGNRKFAENEHSLANIELTIAQRKWIP